MRIVSTEMSWDVLSSLPCKTRMATFDARNLLFSGFSSYQNVNKEIRIVANAQKKEPQVYKYGTIFCASIRRQEMVESKRSKGEILLDSKQSFKGKQCGNES